VVWVDRNNTARGSTVHDVAGIDRANGQTIPLSIEFPGVTNEELALKLAARELQQVCVPLASCTLLVNRKNWGLEPGDCFVLNWAPIGLSGVVFRVTSVEVGLHTEGQLRIKAARDVYGLGPVALTEPAESLWSSPYSAPADAVYRNVQEITWWQFVRAYGESEAVLAELTDDSTGVICFCGRPSPDAINYEMWSRNAGETDYTKRDTDSFPFIGTTAAALDPEVSSTIALQQSYIDTSLVKVGQYAALGDELVAVTAIDTVNMTVTVDRGILDTLPVAHAAGETIWFYQGLFGLDQTPRAEGEQVEVKILPSTTQGRLEIDDATTNTKTLEGRMMRPYPPGCLELNGDMWPEVVLVGSGVNVGWVHRDRLQQTVSFVRQDADGIGPESGVVYNLRVYNEGTSNLIGEFTAIAAEYYNVPAETFSGLDGVDVRFELESERGGFTSFQKWSIVAEVSGASAAVPYRYFRIYITANNGDTYTALQEIEIAVEAAGDDITTPGLTVADSSHYSSSIGAGTIDNNWTNYTGSGCWVSGSGGVPHWVSIDLGEGVTATPAELRMWCQYYAGGPARAPKDFTLQGSNDGTIWTDIRSFTDATGWVVGTAKTFSV